MCMCVCMCMCMCACVRLCVNLCVLVSMCVYDVCLCPKSMAWQQQQGPEPRSLSAEPVYHRIPPMLSCLRIPYLTTRPAVCQQQCLRFRFGRRLLVSRRASPPQTPTFRAAFRMRVKASALPMACLGRVFPRHRLRYSLLHPSLACCLARSLSGTHPHAHTCRHTCI